MIFHFLYVSDLSPSSLGLVDLAMLPLFGGQGTHPRNHRCPATANGNEPYLPLSQLVEVGIRGGARVEQHSAGVMTGQLLPVVNKLHDHVVRVFA